MASGPGVHSELEFCSFYYNCAKLKKSLSFHDYFLKGLGIFLIITRLKSISFSKAAQTLIIQDNWPSSDLQKTRKWLAQDLQCIRLLTSDASEPTFWRAELSFLVSEPSRAEPSFSFFKNEPKRAFKIFRNLIGIFSMHCRKHNII